MIARCRVDSTRKENRDMASLCGTWESLDKTSAPYSAVVNAVPRQFRCRRTV